MSDNQPTLFELPPTVETQPKPAVRWYIYYIDDNGEAMCYWRNISTFDYSCYQFARKGTRKIATYSTYGYAKAMIKRLYSYLNKRYKDNPPQLIAAALED